MNKSQMLIRTLFSVILSFALNSAFSEPANLARLKHEIHVYHKSGAYDKELTHVVTQAYSYMVHRVKNNALLTHPKKLAVVLDIDETSLSNYQSIAAHRLTPTRKQIQQYIEAAEAPAIQPMKSFYTSALKNGVSVFFVTGRKESARFITDKNLRRAGYRDWAGLYLKPENYNQRSVIPFKAQTRETISKLGYTIIESIGDQDSDLKGGYAERTFKLPNPYYYIP